MDFEYPSRHRGNQDKGVFLSESPVEILHIGHNGVRKKPNVVFRAIEAIFCDPVAKTT